MGAAHKRRGESFLKVSRGARARRLVVLIMRRAARGAGGIRARDLPCPAGGTARKNSTYISSGAAAPAPDRIQKAAPDKIRRGAGGLQPRAATRAWIHVGIAFPSLPRGDCVHAGLRSSLVSGGAPRPSGDA